MALTRTRASELRVRLFIGTTPGIEGDRVRIESKLFVKHRLAAK
jgi:hypothetical protein